MDWPTHCYFTIMNIERKGTMPERIHWGAMGCRQCLPLSVVQLKGKHCLKPHCRNGIVDTIGPSHFAFQDC